VLYINAFLDEYEQYGITPQQARMIIMNGSGKKTGIMDYILGHASRAFVGYLSSGPVVKPISGVY
jgi:hypothetical protein